MIQYGLTLLMIIVSLFGCQEAQERVIIQEKEVAGDTVYVERAGWTSDSLGKFSVQGLLDSGFSITPSEYQIDFVAQEKYQDDTIVVSVYARSDRRGWGEVDSISFVYKEESYTLEYVNLTFYSPASLLGIKENKGVAMRFDDFNFDGHPDVAVFNNEASGVKNLVEDIYLFNSIRKRYFRNKLLSETANVSANTAQKTLSTFAQGGMASKIYGSTTYVWEGDSLVSTMDINQHYDDSLEMFIKITQKKVNNTWVTTTDTLTDSEATW